MILIGFASAVLMGLSLGLIGGGGSILTVPILVYLFNENPVIATTYSLFIVGAASAVGSISHVRQGNIDWKTVLVFGSASIFSVFIARNIVLPLIPHDIVHIGSVHLTKSLAMLLLFSLMMIAASYSMINRKECIECQEKMKVNYNYVGILFRGLLIGSFTGLIGAGGGFMIIPALVFLAYLPMKKAIGTSLAIITMNSLVGFLSDPHIHEHVNWPFLLTFASMAVTGILVGSFLTKYIPNEKLKPGFGWFTLFMGLFILAKELFFRF